MARGGDAVKLEKDLFKRMADCSTAEALNDEVIVPFVQAFEAICADRGYVMNIFGDRSNLVVTPEGHADVLYQMIEAYLDEQNVGDGP